MRAGDGKDPGTRSGPGGEGSRTWVQDRFPASPLTSADIPGLEGGASGPRLSAQPKHGPAGPRYRNPSLSPPPAPTRVGERPAAKTIGLELVWGWSFSVGGQSQRPLPFSLGSLRLICHKPSLQSPFVSSGTSVLQQGSPSPPSGPGRGAGAPAPRPAPTRAAGFVPRAAQRRAAATRGRGGAGGGLPPPQSFAFSPPFPRP